MQRVAAWRLANWVGGQIEACLIVLVLGSNSVSFFFLAYPGVLTFLPSIFFFLITFCFDLLLREPGWEELINSDDKRRDEGISHVGWPSTTK
jgi:hypothetical protein